MLEAYAAVVVIDSAAKKAVPLPQDEIPHVAAPAPAPQQLEAVAFDDPAAFRSSFQVRYSDMDSNRYRPRLAHLVPGLNALQAREPG